MLFSTDSDRVEKSTEKYTNICACLTHFELKERKKKMKKKLRLS